MVNSRLELHSKLVTILGSDNVYFQPPSTIRMKYPCIIYKRDAHETFFANDSLYIGMKRYAITIVDQNPDSEISDRILELPYCSFTTHYASDNLNHDVYTLYF